MPLFLPHLCPYTTAACAVAATDVVDVVVNFLSTCCRGRGSEALLVSSYVVCSSPLQPYACTGGRAGYIPPLVPFSAPTCS